MTDMGVVHTEDALAEGIDGFGFHISPPPLPVEFVPLFSTTAQLEVADLALTDLRAAGTADVDADSMQASIACIVEQLRASTGPVLQQATEVETCGASADDFTKVDAVLRTALEQFWSAPGLGTASKFVRVGFYEVLAEDADRADPDPHLDVETHAWCVLRFTLEREGGLPRKRQRTE